MMDCEFDFDTNDADRFVDADGESVSGETFTYDPDGHELPKHPQLSKCVFDAQNRIVSITQSDKPIPVG